jgi:hypothetical protein
MTFLFASQILGHVRKRFSAKVTTASAKRSILKGARRNQRGKATGTSSSVEENGGGRDEEDSKPCLVTSSAARIGSSPGQEAVQEQAATLGEIPYGWTRVKLEPDS